MNLRHHQGWAFALLISSLLLGCRAASAITRGDVVSRAQSWVSVPVPYSQSSYYDGYRQDCSGYVSYCWATQTASGSPISYNTNSLLTVTTSISQNDLKQGDILLNTAGGNTASEFAHVVLFDHWDNSAHTYYWVYEQGPDKTYYHRIPYPYWSNYDPQDYAPRRYQNIDDGDGVLDPTNVYVSLSGSDTSNGSSGAPFRTIKYAIDMASATQATIYIAPGSYGEKISTSKHIHFVTNGNGTVQTGG